MGRDPVAVAVGIAVGPRSSDSVVNARSMRQSARIQNSRCRMPAMSTFAVPVIEPIAASYVTLVNKSQ